MHQEVTQFHRIHSFKATVVQLSLDQLGHLKTQGIQNQLFKITDRKPHYPTVGSVGPFKDA